MTLIVLTAVGGLLGGCGSQSNTAPPRVTSTTVRSARGGTATTTGPDVTGGGTSPATMPSFTGTLPPSVKQRILSCSNVQISESLPGPAAVQQPTTADLEALQQAYEAFSNQGPPNGLIVSSLHLAYMGAENTSYAIASFPTHPGQLQQTVLFYKIPNCVWYPLQYASIPFPCPGEIVVPPGVIAAWKLPAPSASACKTVLSPPTPRR